MIFFAIGLRHLGYTACNVYSNGRALPSFNRPLIKVLTIGPLTKEQ